MKKVFAFVVVMLFSVNAFCQIGIGIGTGGVGIGMHIPINKKKQRMENIESKVQQMKSDLELDSSQVIKVRNLLVERDRKRHKGTPMTREEFNRRMDEILTDDQRARFKELHRRKSHQDPAKKTAANNDSTQTTPPTEKEAEWDDVYR
jgi:hypothetical protein